MPSAIANPVITNRSTADKKYFFMFVLFLDTKTLMGNYDKCFL